MITDTAMVRIEQIEAAINVWRERRPTPEAPTACPTLCAEARALADVYALMIYRKDAAIDASALTTAQAAALQGAHVQLT
ncbi:DUF3717 domain-containing protein [Burkholderia ubonensis]|uniref:DUF3717 domain-containing protein n=1 Tax=Burkholderia ubonensis TaxID=101571 RepID=UPI0007593D8B|nr:DUF3717 domain-containing protein [Burkholderia ubonensis]AOI68856.1 hypothetical protein WI31_04400 [Burkholderia ubonensis]KUZ10195.1 hypothetical protein WI29_33225 [Burkholderia ubonensis]KUZ20395.1 hypothetical protein WI30_34490 [Burkholderia ubonensis]KUZ36328.1 hypothetical protein WI32_14610 [Burkholderia ubonensis]KUZ40540.1 hypothetical protein WI33_34300 [Burkholderia ubonensis]